MRQTKESWRLGIATVLCSIFMLAGVFYETQAVYATETDAGLAASTEFGAAENTAYFKEAEVSMTPSTTKTLKLIGAVGKVRWSSDNKKVASVNSSGKVTAKAKGTAIITAVCGEESYTCTITVKYGTYKAKDGMKYKDAAGSFGYTGRWFKKKIGKTKYHFTITDGSAFYFKVTGSKYVNINFLTNTRLDTPYFAYSVDGGTMKRQKITKKKINVGNSKTHYVRVIFDAMSDYENRWVEEAGIGIKSIKPVTKTGAITAIKPQNDVIAFYGDSITKGVRTLGMPLTPAYASATNTYAWHCADKLNMVPYFAGYSGSGIFEPGVFAKCSTAIGSFSAGRKASSYDADIIVLEHGTNDVYAHGDIFVKEYQKVLKTLHKQHPKAQIVAMIPFLKIHADDIKKAAAPYKKWCTVVETSSWKMSYTDGIHPNAASSKKAGKNLAKKISAIRKAKKK